MVDKVAVVGAGIAGLTLARCLSKAGVPYTIYERGESREHRYGLTLERRAYLPLLNFLGQSEAAFVDAVAVDRFVHGRGELGSSGSSSFRAEHGALIRFLRKGQDMVDRTKIIRAISTRGGLELHSEYGPICTASVVVDAGGESSNLRTALLPDHLPKILPWVAYHGVRQVSAAEFESRYASAFTHGNYTRLEAGQAGLKEWTVLLAKTHLADGQLDLRYTLLRRARPRDKLHRPKRGRDEAKEIPPEFWDEIGAVHKGSDSAIFQAWLDPNKLKKDRLLHWLMRTHIVPPHVRTQMADVGLFPIGDALYSTPIQVSGGANRAMTSAVMLAQAIIEAHQAGSSLALAPYTTTECYPVQNDGISSDMLDVDYHVQDQEEALREILATRDLTIHRL